MSTRPLLVPKIKLVSQLKTPEQRAGFQRIARKLGLQDKQFLDMDDLFAILRQTAGDLQDAVLAAVPELQRYVEETLPAALVAAAGDDPAKAEALGMALIQAMQEMAREKPRA
ncbi:MAG: hypothetical protein JWM80_1555 [Cyanobacteria bacterium RYN_339]|nr:hypothetical protein [Cyanobacteria bacterium RYN_339]